MADLLSTGLSGLLAFRRALDVSSHNVANVATEGYSRQRVDLATRDAQPYGNGWVGNGVAVTTVRRSYDEFLATQARSSSSSLERLDLFADLATKIDNLFADSRTGLSASLQSFVNAVQGVASSPGNAAARQVLLGEAQSLTDRLQAFDSRLRTLDGELGSRLGSEAAEISSLAGNIARLNQDITSGFARTGQPPNDLLDQRDRLLDQLASHLNVQTVAQAGGAVDVFVGSGQALVLNGEAAMLEASADPFDAGRTVLTLRSGSGASDVTARLTGGSLGGALDFRRDLLDPARNALGRIAVAVAESVNAQHHAGLDLRGELGGDLFGAGEVAVLSDGRNAGSATLAVTRTDSSRLTESDYVLQSDAGGWSLARLSDGTAVALSGSGTAADPFRADGLEIVVSGSAQQGDRFLIRPTREAVAGFRVLIDDPARIAAAAPVRTAVGAANAGSGRISAGEVIDAGNPQLRSTASIEFLTPTTYSIDGSGPIAYTAGAAIEAHGWRVTIDGSPAAGDRFTVSDNSSGLGDNRNALALAGVLGRPLLDGATTSVNAAVARFVGANGVTTRQAQLNRDAQQLVHQQALDERQSVSGVNLDEEAANLMRYQQAYQAAAQLIQVANTLFDTLLAATRR